MEISEENSESSKDSEMLMSRNTKIKKKKKSQDNNETFENYIIDAYKKICNLDESSKNDEDRDEEEKGIIYNSQMKLRLKYCEKKLREALNLLKKDNNIVINRNILDKLSRLIQHDKININYIIGNINMILMNKELIFDYDDKEFEINDLILFINKVIQLKDIIKYTKIGEVYSNCLINFLTNITKEFEFENDQLKIINKILDQNKEIQHNNLLQSNIDDLFFSVSDELMRQKNIYEQYKIIIQNSKLIIDMIKAADIDDKELHERYLEFGKNLAYLFFNKSFRVYLLRNDNNNNKSVDSDDEDEDDNDNINVNNDLFGLTYLFFDGYKNKGEVNVLNSEHFYVESDDKIDELRIKIINVIFAYCKKFIELVEIFPIQYVIYVLLKRIYFCFLKKNEKLLTSLLSLVLVNLFFFEDAPLDNISYFINKILKSTKKEDEILKNKITKDINDAMGEKGFLYKFPKSLKHLEVKKEKKIDEKKEKDKDKEKNKDKKNKKGIKSKKDKEIEEDDKEELKKEEGKEEEKKEDDKEEEKKDDDKEEEKKKDDKEELKKEEDKEQVKKEEKKKKGSGKNKDKKMKKKMEKKRRRKRRMRKEMKKKRTYIRKIQQKE